MVKYRRIVCNIFFVFVICLFILLCNAVAAFATNSLVYTEEVVNFSNQSDAVFDGYTGFETTLTGLVGYNYAISLPNGECLRFGFDPRNTTEACNVHDIYGLGSGWQLKLPRMNIKNTSAIEMYRPNGYSYLCIGEKNVINGVDNTGCAYSVNLNNENMFAYNGTYGECEVFDTIGRIMNTTDALGKRTVYEYNGDLISKICYSDDSFVTFNRKGLEIEIVYNQDGISTVLAIFTLEEYGDTFVLSEINADSKVTFKYVNGIKDEILLKSYDNARYERTINYIIDDECMKILNYESIYSDGETARAEYNYGAFNYIDAIVYDNGIETFTYEKLSNNCLKTNTTKNHNNIITETSKTVDNWGHMVSYSYPGVTLDLIYENNRLVLQKENEEVYTYEYNDRGLLAEATFPSGEIITYNRSESGALLSTISSVKGVVNKESDANVFDATNLQRAVAGSVSVEYNINSQVGVTDLVSVYGLTQDAFNCYTYVCDRTYEMAHPGWYSGNLWYTDEEAQAYCTISTMRAFTESDQESLGRTTYVSTLDGEIGTHAWKIALRVRPGEDFHFMKISNGSSGNAYWQFKAGGSGPVMRLLGNNTPAGVTWDLYETDVSTGRYCVGYSGYYVGPICYLIIQD